MLLKVKKIRVLIIQLGKFISSKHWLFTLLITALVIASSIFISIESNRLIIPNSDPAARYMDEKSSPVRFLANWDGVDYIHIADSGYTNDFYTGWFPLYPLLIKIVHYFIGSYLLCGLIVSWLSLWGAVYFFTLIIKEFYKKAKKIITNTNLIKGSLYFLLYPSGIYLLSVYTESLFAFLALAAIYYATKKRLLLASLLTAFSTATHFTGIFIIPLIFFMLLEEKVSKYKAFIVAIVGTLGLDFYMLYLWIYFKNPLQFVESQKVHHWLGNVIWRNIASASILDYAIIALIALSIFYWRKRKLSFSIYSVFFLMIPLIGGQFDGYARYSLMAFPVQFMLVDYFIKKPKNEYLTLITLSAIWTYNVILFGAAYIVH